MNMKETPLIISETNVHQYICLQDALDIVREVFVDTAEANAINFPVVRETLSASSAVFGIKSAEYQRHSAVGLKAGGYFPSNALRGDTNHQSFVILFDQDSGKPFAMIGGNLLTKLRTAAASAISIDILARKDTQTLAVIGAGAQAETHIAAALLVRSFDKIVLWNRGIDRAKALATRWKGDIPIEIVFSTEEAVKDADVVITVTNSTSPLVMKDWIKEGTHLSCMGADTIGKQEIDVGLLTCGKIFTDDQTQSTTIGECQSAFRADLINKAQISLLGNVMLGNTIGRENEKQVTIFDGTGVAAQDIAMAARVVKHFNEAR